MDNDTAARFEKLESHLAHLEHLVDQLNQVVTDQARQFVRFQSQQMKLSASLEAIELERVKATNPKPPHYQ